MRSLALALALALALVGCAYLQEAPACGAKTPESGDFYPVEIFYLNDGDLDGRLCVQLNGEGPFEAVLRRANFTPNTGRLEPAAAVGGDRLQVAAWMGGSADVHRAEFSWAPQNFVVIVTEGNGSLRIDHHAQRPAFD